MGCAAPQATPVAAEAPGFLRAAATRSIPQDVVGSATRVRQFAHWPMVRADRVLRASLIWTALISVLFLVLDGHTLGQVRAFWIGQLPLDLLLAWSSWRVCKLATGAVRRFWGVLGAV